MGEVRLLGGVRARRRARGHGPCGAGAVGGPKGLPKHREETKGRF